MMLRLASDDRVLEVYESEPGKLVIEMYGADPEDQLGGGRFEVDTADFLGKLNRILTSR